MPFSTRHSTQVAYEKLYCLHGEIRFVCVREDVFAANRERDFACTGKGVLPASFWGTAYTAVAIRSQAQYGVKNTYRVCVCEAVFTV